MGRFRQKIRRLFDGKIPRVLMLLDKEHFVAQRKDRIKGQVG
jgi:hypothetical protein